MKLALITPEEALDHIRGRLIDDWIVVMADPVALEMFEREMCPPGTKNCDDFELLLPSIEGLALSIVRKNTRLMRLLGKPKDFDLLLAMFLLPIGHGRVATNVRGYNPRKISKSEAVDKVVEEVRDLISGGGRSG